MEQNNALLPSTHVEENDASYQPPEFEVIPLDCEITAYAPDDGDTPLF
jgi:hypothetical protein